MATPTSNTLGYTAFVPGVGDGAGWGLLSGHKWGGAVGSGITITYSFPNLGQWANNYGTQVNKEYNAMRGLTPAEIGGVKAALSAWAKVANVNFTESADNAGTVGEIRFGATTNISPMSGAHAYYPFTDPSAGDVWYNNNNWNKNGSGTPKGSYDFLTTLHEVGHALGLKHPFDLNRVNDAGSRLNDPFDNYFYTIMSYTASRFSADKDNYASFYPTTPMYYDLLAIQELYGKKTVSSGNTTYTFVDGKRYFQTINDSGGSDSIVYNGTQSAVINLNVKAFSQVSETITFNGGSSRATVAIGPGVVIEKATGGNGSDTLVGNSAANTLTGRAGNDVLRGHAGNDILKGGVGNDTNAGGPGSDSFLFTGAIGFDRILDYSVADDVIKLDNAIFTRLGAPKILPSTWFKKGAAAADGNDYILYHAATGNLIYDPNGSGAGQSVVFADLPSNLAMKNTEFMVI